MAKRARNADLMREWRRLAGLNTAAAGERCEKCGHVGLASRRTRKVHWRSHTDPELVSRAQRWNEWAAKQS